MWNQLWSQPFLAVAITCALFIGLQVIWSLLSAIPALPPPKNAADAEAYGYEVQSAPRMASGGSVWLTLLNIVASIAGLLSFAMQLAQWRGWL
jgi:hypothetical protein